MHPGIDLPGLNTDLAGGFEGIVKIQGSDGGIDVVALQGGVRGMDPPETASSLTSAISSGVVAAALEAEVMISASKLPP
jgi:hypothetical protein